MFIGKLNFTNYLNIMLTIDNNIINYLIKISLGNLSLNLTI